MIRIKLRVFKHSEEPEGVCSFARRTRTRRVGGSSKRVVQEQLSVKRFNVDEKEDFQSVQQRIKSCVQEDHLQKGEQFSYEFKITYMDDESDWVDLNCESDWVEAKVVYEEFSKKNRPLNVQLIVQEENKQKSDGDSVDKKGTLEQQQQQQKQQEVLLKRGGRCRRGRGGNYGLFGMHGGHPFIKREMFSDGCKQRLFQNRNGSSPLKEGISGLNKLYDDVFGAIFENPIEKKQDAKKQTQAKKEEKKDNTKHKSFVDEIFDSVFNLEDDNEKENHEESKKEDKKESTVEEPKEPTNEAFDQQPFVDGEKVENEKKVENGKNVENEKKEDENTLSSSFMDFSQKDDEQEEEEDNIEDDDEFVIIKKSDEEETKSPMEEKENKQQQVEESKEPEDEENQEEEQNQAEEEEEEEQVKGSNEEEIKEQGDSKPKVLENTLEQKFSEELKALSSMGFENTNLNVKLLNFYKGDMNVVLNTLLKL